MPFGVRSNYSFGMWGAGYPQGNASAFSPNDLAGLQLWLKADAIDGLSDSDPVTTWADASSAGNDMTGAGASRPLYRTNIVNSLPAVQFDGADSLSTSGNVTMKPATVIAVSWVDNVSSWRTVLSQTEGWHNRLNIFDGKHNLDKQALVVIGTATANTPVQTWTVSTVTYASNGAYAFYQNGDAEGAGTTDVTFTSNPLTLGQVTGQGWLGYFAEILVYDSVLSSGDLANITAYLSEKYALGI